VTTPSLFPPCPVRCGNLTSRPGRPCDTCLAEFGPFLRPAGTGLSDEQIAAQLADRDDHVRRIYAERRTFVPLPDTEGA
jgi:hypothetical protein